MQAPDNASQTSMYMHNLACWFVCFLAAPGSNHPLYLQMFPLRKLAPLFLHVEPAVGCFLFGPARRQSLPPLGSQRTPVGSIREKLCNWWSTRSIVELRRLSLHCYRTCSVFFFWEGGEGGRRAEGVSQLLFSREWY